MSIDLASSIAVKRQCSRVPQPTTTTGAEWESTILVVTPRCVQVEDARHISILARRILESLLLSRSVNTTGLSCRPCALLYARESGTAWQSSSKLHVTESLLYLSQVHILSEGLGLTVIFRQKRMKWQFR